MVQTAQVLLINQVDLVDLAHPCSGRDSVMALWWGILLLGILLLGILDMWEIEIICVGDVGVCGTRGDA